MSTHHFPLLAETLPLAVTEQGHGQPYLLLHGAAGPGFMARLTEALAQTGRAVLPTHPGFDGEPRPAWCRRIDDLALVYLALLEKLDLHQVVLVAHSLGGWLGAELALRASPRVAALVLLNAAGLDPTPETGPLVSPAALLPEERVAYMFHNPAFAATAGSRPTTEAVRLANQQSVHAYGGEPFMQDPGLRHRLPGLALPTLVLWGASDRLLTPAYGRQFADLIPGAQFELLAEAGHFPQVEQLAAVVARITEFAGGRGQAYSSPI